MYINYTSALKFGKDEVMNDSDRLKIILDYATFFRPKNIALYSIIIYMCVLYI